jgi:hypothetical protein
LAIHPMTKVTGVLAILNKYILILSFKKGPQLTKSALLK